jgi:hypothetical protein
MGETGDYATDGATSGRFDADAGAAGCDGRGKPLDGLEVSTENDAGEKITISFVEGEPMPPIVGNNSWLFHLEADGEPITGVASEITVTPFMPDHGHGTPTAVTVEEERAGDYRFEPVHTRMAGYWEIRIDVDSDVVSANLLFGVCVD